MRLNQIFHHTHKESPYKLELESQNMLARAGFIKKGDTGDYCLSTLGTVFYQGIESHVVDLFAQRGYGKFIGRSPETLFLGDVKSFRHLGKGLVGSHSHTEGSVWPKLGLAECRNRVEITGMHLWEDIEHAKSEIQALTEAFQEQFKFNEASLDVVLDSSEEGPVSSLYYRHELGSGQYLECNHCGEKFSANAPANTCANTSVPPGIELLEMEEVHTPDIRTIQQLEDFFEMPGDQFLKTIIVEVAGAYLGILLKGNRELNMFKLARLLGVHESVIRLADKTTFAESMGVEAGFIGPVGLKNIKMIADEEVMLSSNLICGANKSDYHIKNVNPGRDYAVHSSGDLKSLELMDSCPKCHQKTLSFQKGFKLAQAVGGLADGIHTEQAIKYINQNGKEAQAYASKLTFDLNHIVAMVAEGSQIEGGILFEDQLAPFDFIITLINPEDETQVMVANELYEVMNANGMRVLLDDTDERAGIKFSNADLTGVSKRITVGKIAAEGLVELKNRRANTSEKIEINELMASLKGRK